MSDNVLSMFSRLEARLDRIETKIDSISNAQAQQSEQIKGLDRRISDLEGDLEGERSKRESDRLRVARLEEREKERGKSTAIAGAGTGVGAVGLVELGKFLWDLMHGGPK